MTGKVLVMARSLPHHNLGGMEVLAWSLSCAMARLGLQVSVITTALPNRSEPFIEDGVEIVPLPNASQGRYSPAWWAGSRHYLERHKQEEIAAILSVSAAGFGLLPLKRQFFKVPFIMQAHGTSWGEIVSKYKSRSPKAAASSIRNFLWLAKDLKAYGQFDAVVAVGEEVMEGISSAPIKWVLPKSKRHLINNGIDTTLFCPSSVARSTIRAERGIIETTLVILSANRLHKQKGTAHGLRAFARYARTEPNAQYWIAGDGPELTKLVNLAIELGVRERVSFLGRLDRDELVRYLQAADIFLFLSDRIEVGLPLNILEALATGLPTIVSDHIKVPQSPHFYRVVPRDEMSSAEAITQASFALPKSKKSLLSTEFQLERCAIAYRSLFDTLKG